MFDIEIPKKVAKPRSFNPFLTATENAKGVIDVDTVKGCSLGMKAHPNGGCYGECYANKTATRYGFDFSKSISRKIDPETFGTIFKFIKNHPLAWYRIGTFGDPCHDWNNTICVCERLEKTGKIPVIVTKHWIELNMNELLRLKKLKAVINTSTSALDSDNEIKYRTTQIHRIEKIGIRSVCRVVTCNFGESKWAKACREKQTLLLSINNIIDNPLRTTNANKHVKNGDIILTRIDKAVGGGGKLVSLHKKNIYLGKCGTCPDQCGINFNVTNKLKLERDKMKQKQLKLFTDKIDFSCVESVIGSGYEEDVAKLAIEDGVAYRAARKNMQIHSAIILKVNDIFSGFFTFQVNHIAKEFCLLQSAIVHEFAEKKLYSKMVKQIIDKNTFGYPMIMTVSTKHPLECPKVFKALGFITYLKLSGFAYMVYGTMEQVRMKRLAHATMTNAWTTTRSDWLKMKKEWNGKIEDAGEKHNIPNPKFASRDGCWQGSNGYSNVVLSSNVIEDGKVKHKKGKSFNGNASVLDPVACEVILRFFMPTDGSRVYNPFGGGVQFGFVTGHYGYEYVASEIRQNQCDANNAICHDLNSAKWIKSDSSIYNPKGEFDLCFSCPPYYKVEKYIDYEGVIPEGELNNIPTYDEFRDTLFKGYKKAISKLKNNRFFVVMTGDSRDKTGAYYGCEAEHELFFRDQGLSIYNKITYLECEFTRLAHAKRTLDYRKFPKREQKILVFFKGDMKTIKNAYPSLGRL